MDDRTLARGEYVARDAGGVQDTDLAPERTLRHARIQFVGLVIVQEQRSAFRIQFSGRGIEQCVEHFVKRVGDGHPARHFEKQFGLAQAALL